MSEALFPTRWKHDRPPSIEEFVAAFPDDHACAAHLARRRWPRGFVCPHCGHPKGWKLETRPWLWQCASSKCRKQTSVISGTIMHGTRVPLRKWFLAAYLMATHSNGISALQLQAKLGIRSYQTVWLLVQKLRIAMIDPDRSPLTGLVEVDESSIPYRTNNEPLTGGQGKSTVGKTVLIGAVEKRDGRTSGRIRLERIDEDTREHIRPFVLENTAPGCTLFTDGNKAYVGLPDRKHVPRNLSAKNALPAHVTFERIHRVFSNLKRWALGVFHGLREKHVDLYLNEFVFRWNRRRSYWSSMDTLLGIGQRLPRITRRDIVGDTLQWKKDHEKQILKMVGKERLLKAQILAVEGKRSVIEALHMLPPEPKERKYDRERPFRPVLGRPPEGERLIPGRYRHPPRPSKAEMELGWLRHMRPAATQVAPF
ncbi:Transposase zinc-ribbon domain-containing protein [Consotaella salsifontis]|uniref:Transposase zinc-ribbon domain-containing protein n=1 Tax=Consotaella salsifontis TaxID=1365950 RepID=A0A1T4QTG6_9HYPH|nr:Transposase zinc-ribbon domain-containing protein [Consotaella salsifontis]